MYYINDLARSFNEVPPPPNPPPPPVLVVGIGGGLYVVLFAILFITSLSKLVDTLEVFVRLLLAELNIELRLPTLLAKLFSESPKIPVTTPITSSVICCAEFLRLL